MNKLKNVYKSNFTTVGNEIINDRRIKPHIRFLYIYLASKPDDWDFHNSVICSDLGIGEDTFKRWCKALINSGWMTKRQTLNTDGTFGCNEYELYETPIDTPSLENTRTGKTQRHIKKELSSTKDELLSPSSKETSLPDGREVRETPISRRVFSLVGNAYSLYQYLLMQYPNKSEEAIYNKYLGLYQWRITNTDKTIVDEEDWMLSIFKKTKRDLEPRKDKATFLSRAEFEKRWANLIIMYNEIFNGNE